MLTRRTPPAAFITLPEAKAHLRVGHNEDDMLIQGMIEAAIEWLDGPDGYTGQAIGDQEWTWKTANFQAITRIPLGPIISVDEVRYRDLDDFDTVLPSSEFYVHFDAQGYYLKPKSQWPSTYARDDAVTVEFTAGMGTIKRGLKNGALMIVAHLYANREVQVDTETFPSGFGMWDLVAPYRRVF